MRSPVQRQIAANKEDDEGSDSVSYLLTDRDLATARVLDLWQHSHQIAQLQPTTIWHCIDRIPILMHATDRGTLICIA